MTKNRTLKVEPFDRGFWQNPKSLIRLKGKWLREAGFEPGYTVTIRVTPGEIVLSIIDEEQPPQLRQTTRTRRVSNRKEHNYETSNQKAA